MYVLATHVNHLIWSLTNNTAAKSNNKCLQALSIPCVRYHTVLGYVYVTNILALAHIH